MTATSSTARMALCRKRRRKGQVLVTCWAGPELARELVKLGWLDKHEPRDPFNVADSVQVLLGYVIRQGIRRPPPPTE